MNSTLIVTVLLALVAMASIALMLDARQRRIGRHVAGAVSTREVELAPSLRRAQVVSRWSGLYRLFNYKTELTYPLRPEFTLLGGAIAAGAAFYVCGVLDLSPFTTTIAGAAAAFMMIRGLFGWQERRIANQLFRQLPDAIEIVTSAVRSGLPINEAFRTIAREMPNPTSQQFTLVCNDLNLGKPLEEAIEGVYRRTGVQEYGFFAVTVSVQVKAGGSLAETLQTLADTVRQRVALAGRAKALAGEVIFSSRALSLAPVIIGGILYLINPEMIDLLLTDPTGKKLLVYAASSVVFGSLVIRWMINRETAL